IVAPAVGAACGRHATGTIARGGSIGQTRCAAGAEGGKVKPASHGPGAGPGRVGAVAERAVPIVAPTVRRARRGEAARVREASSYRREHNHDANRRSTVLSLA